MATSLRRRWAVWFLAWASVALCTFQASGASAIQITWDPSPDPDIEAYKIYYGKLVENEILVVRVGNVTKASISGLQLGVVYFFYVTAINSAGMESEPSNIMTWPADPWQQGRFSSASGAWYAESFRKLGDLLWQRPDRPACSLYVQPGGTVVLDSSAGRNAAIVGYNLYYGDAEENEIHSVSLGTVPEPVAIKFQAGHTYFFFTTVIDGFGNESEPSSILIYLAGGNPSGP